MTTLTIDCQSCHVRGPACADCVISVLLDDRRGAPATLTADESTAVAALAASGLVPPLRLVPSTPPSPDAHRAVG